jgi:hypothetical protein
MIKRLFVVLVISLCIFAVAFHFIVEGLGGVQDHFAGRQNTGMLHSHDGDQFVLGESGAWKTAQTISAVLVTSSLNQITRPLPPPFHPPKSS